MAVQDWLEGEIPGRISCGGARLFPLPAGPSGAGRARGLLESVMRSLDLSEGLIEDGVLAVSELATNAHLHAGCDGDGTGAEVWIWARTLPRPQLVVSVFDIDRTSKPRSGSAELLDEGGKGLAIVEALASEWGAHFTRSRLGPVSRPGKRVWFCMALPGPWPSTLRVVPASLASKRLLDLLRLRGIDATRTCDDKGISLVRAGHLNIWVEPKSFAWCDGNGGYVRLPHLDLQEVVEGVLAAIEHSAVGSSPARAVPPRP